MNTGYKLPQSVLQNAVGVNSWTDPTNILLVDGDFAVSSGPTNIMTVGNFLLNIPQDTTISNFTIKVKGYRGSFNTTLQIYAIDDTSGVELSYPMTPFQGFNGTNTLYTLSTTTFSTTWTTDQANNIKLRLIADGELYLDAIQIDCSYFAVTPVVPTPPPSGSIVVDEFVQGQRFQLAQSMTSASLFCMVQSFNYPDGNPIQISDFYGDALIVIDQGKEGLEENIRITNIEHNFSGTGMTKISFDDITNRGLEFKYPYTHNINLCKDHSGTAEVVISNSAPFYDRFLRKNQIDALVSPPITASYEDNPLTTTLHEINLKGAGVIGTVDPFDPNKIDYTIAGAGGTTPPQIVNVSSSSSGSTQVGSITWQHETTGIDRFLVVQVSLEGGKTVTGITYNGLALTNVNSITNGATRTETWRLLAPPLGTYDIIVTFSAASYCSAGAIGLTGVDQTTFIGTIGTNSGNTPGPFVNISTTYDYSIVLDVLGTAFTPIVQTPVGSTLNWQHNSNTDTRQGSGSYQQAGTQPALVSMSYVQNQSTPWAMCAVEIKGITSSVVPGTDEFVKATAADTTASYLDDKITLTPASPNITITKTILNPGANEEIQYAIDSTGGGGAGNNLFTDQTPLGTATTYPLLAGTIDGVNTTFTVDAGSYVSGSLDVYLNGVLLQQGSTEDWVETSPIAGTFDFIIAPIVGDIITAVYQTTAGGVGAQTGIQWENEGVNLGTSGTVNEVDFVGAGVTASRAGDKVTVSIAGGGGGGLGAGQFLPIGKAYFDSSASQSEGLVFNGQILRDVATSRIYAVFNASAGSSTSERRKIFLRIFRNQYGSYYLENTIEITGADLSTPGTADVRQTRWATDGSYIYALVLGNYVGGSAPWAIDLIRYDLDGLNPVVVNIYYVANKTQRLEHPEWDVQGGPGSAQAIVIDGTSLYTTWLSRPDLVTPFSNQFREYDISLFPVVSLANTYTVADPLITDGSSGFQLSYNSGTSTFYLSCSEDTSSSLNPRLVKYTIVGPALTLVATVGYEDFVFGNNYGNGGNDIVRGYYYSLLEFNGAYTTFFIVQILENTDSGGGGTDYMRTYWLEARDYPTI